MTRHHGFALALLVSAAVLAAGCGQQPPKVEEGPIKRNVAIKVMQPVPIEVKLKLPVTLRAREVIELRAPVAGTITSLPFEEGAVVPASTMPAATWVEAEAFLKANPGHAVTDEAVLMRNLAHLDGLKTFARIDDRTMRINFAEAQSQYDATARTLARVAGYKDSSEAQLDAARTAMVTARTGCERLLKMIADCYIISPAQGVLTKRFRRAGEYVNGGELIGTIAVLDPMVAELHVPEAHRDALEPGSEIEIEVQSVTDNLGKPVAVKGRVRLVDSVAHAQTHSFRVEADIPNPDRTLPAGVFGTIRLLVYQRADALTVPLSALRLRGESISLFVVADGKAREIKGVTLGRIHDTWAELLGDSIKPGQKVVVSGTQLIADGDEVVVREDPTAPAAADKAKEVRP